MVIAPVGMHRLRAPAGPAAPPPDRRGAPQQRHELRDVVAVAAGQGQGQRDGEWLLALPRAAISLKAITPVPGLFSGLS
jgi:hypothetical protein